MVLACEVALEAAHSLDAALAFGFLAREIRARGRVDPAAGDRDDVQRSVELAVAGAAETVPIVPARGGWDWCDAWSGTWENPHRGVLAGERPALAMMRVGVG